MREFLDAVVVTGAGRGIGSAVARRIAENGVPVLCISRTRTCERLAAELTSEGANAHALVVDLSSPSSTGEQVAAWLASVPYQRIGAVLAAGVLGEPGGLLGSNLDDWDYQYRVNVLGNLAVVKALLPRMLDARFGRIIAFAGGGAAYANPMFSGYSLSKTAAARATENLQEELKDKGDFLLVCLAPGAVDTDMLQQVRVAGGPVRTTTDISEPVTFVEEFLQARTCPFSGRFVHVRDDWRSLLNTDRKMPDADRWMLRRVEK